MSVIDFDPPELSFAVVDAGPPGDEPRRQGGLGAKRDRLESGYPWPSDFPR